MKNLIAKFTGKSNKSTKTINKFKQSALKAKTQKAVKGGTSEFVIIEDHVDA